MKTIIAPGVIWPTKYVKPRPVIQGPRKRVRIEKPKIIEVDYLREAREQIAMIKRYKDGV